MPYIFVGCLCVFLLVSYVSSPKAPNPILIRQEMEAARLQQLAEEISPCTKLEHNETIAAFLATAPKQPKPKALVTGGAGFIGSQVVKYLLSTLKFNVVVLDNLSTGYEMNVSPEAVLVKGDVSVAADVDNVFKGHGPFDYVYHLAAPTIESASMLSSLWLVNASATQKPMVQRFVFVSSIASFSPPSDATPLTEESRQQPTDAIGISKLASELQLRAASKKQGLKYTILRPHDVYGPLLPASKNVVGRFLRQCERNVSMTIYGDGLQARAFTFIDDVVSLIGGCVAFPNAVNEAYNIGNDDAVSIVELSKLVAQVSKVPHNVTYADARIEVIHAFVAHNKAKCAFNYPQFTSLINGLEQTVAHLHKVDATPAQQPPVSTPTAPGTAPNAPVLAVTPAPAPPPAVPAPAAPVPATVPAPAPLPAPVSQTIKTPREAQPASSTTAIASTGGPDPHPPNSHRTTTTSHGTSTTPNTGVASAGGAGAGAGAGAISKPGPVVVRNGVIEPTAAGDIIHNTITSMTNPTATGNSNAFTSTDAAAAAAAGGAADQQLFDPSFIPSTPSMPSQLPPLHPSPTTTTPASSLQPPSDNTLALAGAGAGAGGGAAGSRHSFLQVDASQGGLEPERVGAAGNIMVEEGHVIDASSAPLTSTTPAAASPATTAAAAASPGTTAAAASLVNSASVVTTPGTAAAPAAAATPVATRTSTSTSAPSPGKIT